MKHQILKLNNSGKWIPYNLVIYYEEEQKDKIQNDIFTQYPLLSKKALENNVLFLHPLGLKSELDSIHSVISDALHYNHPEWTDAQIKLWMEEFEAFIKNIDYDRYYDSIYRSVFNYQAPNPVSLVRRLDEDRIVVWDFESLINKNGKVSIPKECFYGQLDFNLQFLYSHVHGEIYEDIADGPYEYDVDYRFEYDGDRLSREIRDKMAILSKKGLYGNLIETILFAAKECGIEIKPELAPYELTPAQLNAHKDPRNKWGIKYPRPKKDIIWDSEPTLSSIKVDEHFRIILPRYNNLEIKLTPLPKALYILFLKHPEGILLKHLADYREELVSIYNRVTNRSEPIDIDKSISAILDPTNNSVNEKCSRIKEAFLKEMDDSVARNYYINGERGQPKKILLRPFSISLSF